MPPTELAESEPVASPPTLGGAIRAARELAGFTRAELADWVGVSGKQVGKWENNAARPNAYNAGELSRVLGVSVDELGWSAE
ncbi:helix-turn-helix transcriptional regulator [Nocardia sp. NPDC127579]|uniref:helix-turn-helix transcriptional regulator n=1 Tax=Nocardia sp. NPDC127579 TaxID=3345402 RepID=UPI00363204C7